MVWGFGLCGFDWNQKNKIFKGSAEKLVASINILQHVLE